jgi:hypothetical protein
VATCARRWPHAVANAARPISDKNSRRFHRRRPSAIRPVSALVGARAG